jgi:hypothetical protein
VTNVQHLGAVVRRIWIQLGHQAELDHPVGPIPAKKCKNLGNIGAKFITAETAFQPELCDDHLRSSELDRLG